MHLTRLIQFAIGEVEHLPLNRSTEQLFKHLCLARNWSEAINSDGIEQPTTPTNANSCVDVELESLNQRGLEALKREHPR